MTAIEVWYDEDSDEPTVVHTPGELDAVLDAVAAAGSDAIAPSMVQLAVAEAPPYGKLVVNAGLGATVGVLSAVGRGGGLSLGDPSKPGTVTYDYMGNTREFPASAEVPIEKVRAALHEYVATGGGRPTNVRFETDAERKAREQAHSR